jgi:hypothetical protein
MLSKVPQLAVPNPVTQVTPAALFNRRLHGLCGAGNWPVGMLFLLSLRIDYRVGDADCRQRNVGLPGLLRLRNSPFQQEGKALPSVQDNLLNNAQD